ncbi:MAG: hypothetical protein ABJB86_20725 [Bacteroidota bacterium]
MKILYTILFFSDLAVLIELSYLFLTKIDAGHQLWFLILLILGMGISIALLIYFLSAYINLPSQQEQQ